MFSFFLTSCRKNDIPPNSGIVTINNNREYDDKRQTWYVFGFLFSKANLVSNLESPSPDITIDNDGTLSNLILQANSYQDSFYKIGEYADAALAEKAFKNLTSPSVPQWVVWADSIKSNQVWVYRTGSENYAKIRIISTKNEIRNNLPYGESTFEWLYQPDGSLTFPGK